MFQDFLEGSSRFTGEDSSLPVKVKKTIATCLQQDSLILVEGGVTISAPQATGDVVRKSTVVQSVLNLMLITLRTEMA